MRKKHKVMIILLSIFSQLIVFTIWLYIINNNVPNVYGQFSPPTGNPLDTSTSLIFQGRKYKNMSQNFGKKGILYFFPGRTVGQIKTAPNQAKVTISSVFFNQDWLVVHDSDEMGYTAVFQKEK